MKEVELREIPAALALNLPSVGHSRRLCLTLEHVRSDHTSEWPLRNLGKP